MKSHEPFIEPESTYYVYSPSLLGRSMFFYPLTCGHFFYAPGYHLHALFLTAFFLFMSKKEACMYKQKTKALMQKLMSLF